MRRAVLSALAELLVKLRDYVFKMFLFKKLSRPIVLCSVHCTLVHVYVHIKKLSLRACSGGKSVDRPNCVNGMGVRSVDL